MEHSCGECRRRKSKCDRQQPRCSNCAKHRRNCAYTRIDRTPLTRKYVSELERELSHAQELLRRSTTDLPPRESPRLGLANREYPRSPTVTDRASVIPGNSTELEDGRDGNVSRSGTLQSRTSPQQPPPLVAASQLPMVSPSFSLETPPASGDFDWDERNLSNADGMASLTNRSSRGGYLGVASGAALLRLADADEQNTSGDGSNEHDDPADEVTQVSTPITRAIYSLSYLEPFINDYFRLYHVSYPIVHEATFRAQFMEIIPRPKNKAWHVLLHIIAALGAFTAAETANDADAALFQAAKARLSIDMLETGNLSLVQALTLISNYVQKRNKPNSGYNYLGLAKRVAMGIGLHKEFATWHANPLMLEMRRRVWWALFVFDVGASITFSRPLDQPDGGVEVNLPGNVHDTDITITTRHCPEDVHEVTIYSHVRCQSQFHLCTAPIYARLLSTPFPDSKELLELDDIRITRFVASLPPYFQEHAEQPTKFRLCHAILRWRYRNFRILMYRAFVIRRIMLKIDRGGSLVEGSNHSNEANQFDRMAIGRCLDAASETVDLITKFWQYETHSMMACWYGLYFLFQAILIPVICLRNEPQADQASMWRDQIVRSSEVIADMSRLNQAAARCHKTIMSLCGVYLNQNQGTWNEPVQESPQTQLNGLYPFMWPMLDSIQTDGYDSALQESAIQDFMNQINGI